MYRADELYPTYPVFNRIDGRAIPCVGLKGLAIIVAVALLGYLLFAATGNITHAVEVSTDDATRYQIQARYDLERTGAAYVQQAAILNDEGISDAERAAAERNLYLLQGQLAASSNSITGYVSRSADGIVIVDEAAVGELAAAADKDGITADMDSAQIASLIPATTPVVRPYVDDAPRFIGLAAVPTLLALALIFERDGVSLSRLLKIQFAWMRAQRTYRYGERYWRRELGKLDKERVGDKS
jgi:hypothetical protein